MNFVNWVASGHNLINVRRSILICSALAILAGCESSPQRKQAEAIAKRNPLDMAGEDSKTIVVGGKKAKPPKPPKVPTADAREAPFVSAKNGKVYHCRNCEVAGKLDSPVGYITSDDAERAGKMPCEFCKPREFAASASPNER